MARNPFKRFYPLRISPARSIALLGVLFVAGLCKASSALSDCGRIDRMAQIQVKQIPVSVELAISEPEKHCGLSFRNALAPDHGMLFVYSDDRIMTFWMKDTRIPLSIAFIAASGTILNILEMAPMDSNARYRSSAPARFALEMAAGWFTEHQVKAGDQVSLESALPVD